MLTNDYVWHEVLAAGDAEVIEVLLQISVVDRVNTSLAAAITGNPNAGALLLRGEAQGLFVHRIGSDGWFRIHGLVREVLLAELVRQSRDREHHERAARWLENAGEVVSALEQWLLAQRPREALRLVSSRSSMLYDSGHEAAIIRTIELIPRAVVAGDMSALIEVAVSLILVSRSKFFDAVLEAAWHAERSSDEYSGQIAALQSIALTVQGDWTQGGASARRGTGRARRELVGRSRWSIRVEHGRTKRRAVRELGRCRRTRPRRNDRDESRSRARAVARGCAGVG